MILKNINFPQSSYQTEHTVQMGKTNYWNN